MGQWDKLVEKILAMNKNVRFGELDKAMRRMGYTVSQPKGGSSHYIYRKAGCMPITIPKHQPMGRAYIEMVAEIVRQYLKEDE